MIKAYMTEEEILKEAEERWNYCQKWYDKNAAGPNAETPTYESTLEDTRRLAARETKIYEREQEIIRDNVLFDLNEMVEKYGYGFACKDETLKIAKEYFKKVRDDDIECRAAQNAYGALCVMLNEMGKKKPFIGTAQAHFTAGKMVPTDDLNRMEKEEN